MTKRDWKPGDLPIAERMGYRGRDFVAEYQNEPPRNDNPHTTSCPHHPDCGRWTREDGRCDCWGRCECGRTAKEWR
jgi:hypothetical protein